LLQQPGGHSIRLQHIFVDMTSAAWRNRFNPGTSLSRTYCPRAPISLILLLRRAAELPEEAQSIEKLEEKYRSGHHADEGERAARLS
jgi:hypothetical protein